MTPEFARIPTDLSESDELASNDMIDLIASAHGVRLNSVEMRMLNLALDIGAQFAPTVENVRRLRICDHILMITDKPCNHCWNMDDSDELDESDWL